MKPCKPQFSNSYRKLDHHKLFVMSFITDSDRKINVRSSQRTRHFPFLAKQQSNQSEEIMVFLVSPGATVTKRFTSVIYELL
jgi:hypothetical protein